MKKCLGPGPRAPMVATPMQTVCLAKLASATENKRLSIWQFCRHWWHRKLSLRQLTVPPVTTKLSNWRSFVFNEILACSVPIIGTKVYLIYWEHISVKFESKSASFRIRKGIANAVCKMAAILYRPRDPDDPVMSQPRRAAYPDVKIPEMFTRITQPRGYVWR